MNRGDIWLAQVGRKARPVLVLTRRVGSVDEDTLRQVCWSVSYALGC